MKKRMLVLLLCTLALAMTLAGCGGADSGSSPADEPQTSGALFADVADYPRMDGSTANLPLMAQVMADTCGITLEEAEALSSCTTTTYAWLNLIDDQNDILLVYEASAGTKAQLDESGVALESDPVGRDGLVFIVNENNPVNSLTTQQLVDIYTGKITNWSEVGGEDKEIVAYQRDEASGSQSLFMKLVMGDTAPMAAPTELAPQEMGELIDSLASYNNSANAIGFSVFYYAEYMYTQPGLKMIAVDNVEPSDETIGDGIYPFLNPFYVVIRADEPADSPARQLHDWILSDEGRSAVVKAGYIPAE